MQQGKNKGSVGAGNDLPTPPAGPVMKHALGLSFLIAALLGWAAPGSATERVDLELVIATDVSRSIDEEEAHCSYYSNRTTRCP